MGRLGIGTGEDILTRLDRVYERRWWGDPTGKWVTVEFVKSVLGDQYGVRKVLWAMHERKFVESVMGVDGKKVRVFLVGIKAGSSVGF